MSYEVQKFIFQTSFKRLQIYYREIANVKCFAIYFKKCMWLLPLAANFIPLLSQIR